MVTSVSSKIRLARAVVPVVLALLLCACSGGSQGTTATTAVPGTGSNGGGGQVLFNVKIDFTGDDTIQGTFADSDTGSGFASCAEYSSTTVPGLGWLGPAPAAGGVTEVGGKSVSFLVEVADFNGPGTYTGKVFDSLQIGGDTFQGNESSTVTVNADGSGSGSFSDLQDIGVNSGTESGTLSWTCSG